MQSRWGPQSLKEVLCWFGTLSTGLEPWSTAQKEYTVGWVWNLSTLITALLCFIEVTFVDFGTRLTLEKPPLLSDPKIPCTFYFMIWKSPTLFSDISYFLQTMDGLPDYTIPTVVSFLGIKQLHRCACISKKWKQNVQERKLEIRKEARKKRAQVCDFY